MGRYLKSVAQKLSCRYADEADNLDLIQDLITSFRAKYSESVKEKQCYSTIFIKLSHIPGVFYAITRRWGLIVFDGCGINFSTCTFILFF